MDSKLSWSVNIEVLEELKMSLPTCHTLLTKNESGINARETEGGFDLQVTLTFALLSWHMILQTKAVSCLLKIRAQYWSV